MFCWMSINFTKFIYAKWENIVLIATLLNLIEFTTFPLAPTIFNIEFSLPSFDYRHLLN